MRERLFSQCCAAARGEAGRSDTQVIFYRKGFRCCDDASISKGSAHSSRAAKEKAILSWCVRTEKPYRTIIRDGKRSHPPFILPLDFLLERPGRRRLPSVLWRDDPEDTEGTGMKMIGIYLAAGRSCRMGFDKRYLPFNHEPLGSIALKKALRSKLDHTLVVVRRGESFGWLDSSFFSDSFEWSPVVCEEASQGQSFSLKSGVLRAVEEGADAVIILLADHLSFLRSLSII